MWAMPKPIYATRHGSRAYGLATSESDLDVKGVFVAGKDHYLGFLEHPEQFERKEPHDLVYYEIRKFFSLATACNPNIIEVLYTDDSDILQINKFGEKLRRNRELFLSTKVKFTFSGYAVAQLKRINTHYKWLKDPPKGPPSRNDFGLPEERALVSHDQLSAIKSMIYKKIGCWGIEEFSLDSDLSILLHNKISDVLAEITANATTDLESVAMRSLHFDENFISIVQRESAFRQKQSEWKNYLEWKRNRNPKRAELEAKYGYDCKHAMHLVRLMKMCEEILTAGNVVVKRPDREDLLAIRNGSMTYEGLIEWAKAKDADLESFYKSGKSPLPKEPNKEKLNALCIEIVEEYLASP